MTACSEPWPPRVCERRAGSGVDSLVQVRVSLASIAHWPAFNAAYAQGSRDARPARAVVPTGPLHFGLRIEIEATALAG